MDCPRELAGAVEAFIWNRGRRVPAYLVTEALPELRQTLIREAQFHFRLGDECGGIDAMERVLIEFERPWRDWKSWPWG